MLPSASTLLWCSLCVLLVCLGDVSVPVSSQKYFKQVVERSEKFAARHSGALQWVQRTTTFRDGLRQGNPVTLTNYFVSRHSTPSPASSRIIVF